MASSQVFFTNLRTTPTSNLLDKMERLVRRAGIAGIDFENRFAAIKIHFGEPGNMAYCGPSTPPGWPDCCVRSARNRS